MTTHQNEIHAKKVEEWELAVASLVSVEERPSLFAKAIQAIEGRSLATLSSVTVLVVIDRAIELTKMKYSCLSNVKAYPDGMDLDDFLRNSAVTSAEQVTVLRELLIVLLNLLGNITADILTSHLHEELAAVTAELTLKSSTHQTLLTMNLAKKQGQQ